MSDDAGARMLPISFLPISDKPLASTPAVYKRSDAYGGRVSKYQREKADGLRRANGARKLKRLTNRHMEIVARHISGESGADIALVMSCTQVTVSRILNDPLARAVISQVYEDRQNEIDALAGDAIHAVRETFKGNHTTREKLQAVDKFVKLKESIGKQDDSAQTAEDVIARIFRIENSNVQINVGDK